MATKKDEPTINCLRCAHCKLLPHTDFSKAVKADGTPNQEASIPIHCGKTGRNAPAFIWTHCDIADGNYKWKKGTSKPQGDKCRISTPAERRFLIVHYAKMSWEGLECATGRTMAALKVVTKGMGINRAEYSEKQRTDNLASARKRIGYPTFNDAQRDYVKRCYESGYWPTRAGQRYPAAKARNDAIKADLEKNIAILGYPFKWRAICCHNIAQQPGYAVRHKKWRQRQKQKVGAAQ